MNFQAYSDKVWTLPVKCLNPSTMLTQLFPAGSGLAVTSSQPNSLGASLNTVNNTLVLTPKVQNSLGISVTVTGIGLVPATLVVDVAPDPNQLAIVIDTVAADVTATPQNVPVAPGP